MALRTIVTKEDPILLKKSRDVTKFDERLHILLDDMAETMYEANGVGLAAVQVGVLRRVLIVDIGDGLIELINPTILTKSEETQCGAEGCLSFPGEDAIVIRPNEVTVEAQDRDGNSFQLSGVGLKARAFCHEIDHLNGIVFHDREATDAEIDAWEEEHGVLLQTEEEPELEYAE